MSGRCLLLAAALFLSALINLTGAPFSVERSGTSTATDAGDLVTELRSMRPDHEVVWTGTLQIFGRGHKITPIPIFFESKLTETNWSFIYSTSATDQVGAEKLTIIFSTNAPTQYLYARADKPGAAVGETKKLTGVEADVPLAGSDFWLSDLGFEFYHWPQQKKLKGEQKRGQACYVIESKNPQPNPGGYGRVMTWVDEKVSQPLQADAYAPGQPKTLKRFEVGSVTNIHGHWEVKDLKMFNDKTGSRTELNFDLKDK